MSDPSRGRALVSRTLALVLLALLAACTAKPTPEESPAVVLELAATRIERASSYHFLVEVQGGTVPIARGFAMRRAEGTAAGPNRLDTTVLVSVGPIDAKVGVRVIDADSWITNPLTGLWERDQVTVAQLFDLGGGVTALMRGATDVKLAGTETIDGVATRRFEGTLPSDRLRVLPGVPPGGTLRTTAWVGVDDDLVRRLEASGPIFAGSSGPGTVRVSLSHFDEPVTFGPPF